MPLVYKIDVLSALKEAGYNTNKIRTEGLLSQSTLQKLREGKGLSWENLERICSRRSDRVCERHGIRGGIRERGSFIP